MAQALAGVGVAMLVIFMTADMFSFAMEMGMFFLLFGVTGALWRLTGGQQGGIPAEHYALGAVGERARGSRPAASRPACSQVSWLAAWIEAARSERHRS